MNTLRLHGTAAVVGAVILLSGVPALAQQGPPGCAWNKYL
jgi:hypothetical protein